MTYQSRADLGGRTGFGPVAPQADEPVFHAEWEPLAFALTLAMGATGSWNLDMSRSARETLPDYLSLSYYQIWLKALCKLLAERGLVSEDEIVTGQMLHPAQPVTRVLVASDVSAVLSKGAPTDRPSASPAKFEVGQKIRTVQVAPAHHTRLPTYARGKPGRIANIRGVHVFPDSNSQGLGEQPQWLYNVVFDGKDLWGDGAAAGLTVRIDAWEPYLERMT